MEPTIWQWVIIGYAAITTVVILFIQRPEEGEDV